MNVNDYLIEIMERLGRIEAKQDSMQVALEAHAVQDSMLKAEVDEVRVIVNKGQAQISLIKWLVGVGVALAGVAVKLLKPSSL